jgi:hypothetical protein
MHKLFGCAALIAAGALGAMCAGGEAHAADVCYKWVQGDAAAPIFPDVRLRLDVRPHSRLSTREELKNFGHPLQVAHSVHGKCVNCCKEPDEGPGTFGGGVGQVSDADMEALTGTVITAAEVTAAGAALTAEAHMGLEVHASRGLGFREDPDFCRSIEIDCTAELDVDDQDASVPAEWDKCEARNEFDIYLGVFQLERVDPATDELCSVFVDGPID